MQIVSGLDYPPHPGLPPFEPLPPAPAYLGVVQEGVLVARAGLWGQGGLGAIGHFAAVGRESGVRLLRAACERLRQQGCVRAVAPLDGSTWFGYRWVVETSDEPPFLLEPRNPLEYAGWAREAGFTAWQTYRSTLHTVHVPDPRAAELEARFARLGLRHPAPQTLEADLRGIHALSNAAFVGNPLFSPLDWPSFEALYRPLVSRVPPEWVWIAEDGGRTVGFLLSLPDPTQPGTLLAKTLAIAPGREYAGLGRWLAECFYRQAFRAGFRRVIHALMWESNRSTNLQGHGRVIRRYALFAREL